MRVLLGDVVSELSLGRVIRLEHMVMARRVGPDTEENRAAERSWGKQCLGGKWFDSKKE